MHRQGHRGCNRDGRARAQATRSPVKKGTVNARFNTQRSIARANALPYTCQYVRLEGTDCGNYHEWSLEDVTMSVPSGIACLECKLREKRHLYRGALKSRPFRGGYIRALVRAAAPGAELHRMLIAPAVNIRGDIFPT